MTWRIRDVCGLCHRPIGSKAWNETTKKMGVMIFGEPPAFDKIVETLSSLEKEIT